MKAILVIRQDENNQELYVLEIHPDNDLERIALEAWNEKYLKDDAQLLLVYNIVDNSNHF